MPITVVRGASIEYEVRGQGPPLILVNGLGFGRWGWFKQVPAFERHFRTITFDVRGEREVAGVPDLAAEVAALLDGLGVGRVHVMGASLGGFVAQDLAIRRPDLVDRLVLVSTSYGGRGPESMSFGAMARMFGWGALSAERAARRGLEVATSDAYRARYPEEFERVVRTRLADSPSLSAYYEQAMAGARFDASREVRRITSPTLVIHGAEDRYVPAANAVALASAIPGARLRVLDDAGHLVFIERSADVNGDVIAFLEGREVPGREARSYGPRREPGRAGNLRRAARKVRTWLGGA